MESGPDNESTLVDFSNGILSLGERGIKNEEEMERAICVSVTNTAFSN